MSSMEIVQVVFQFSLLIFHACHAPMYSAPQKVSFRPETGPEFPQNDKNTQVQKKIWPASIRKKYFACFGAETYFLWAL